MGQVAGRLKNHHGISTMENYQMVITEGDEKMEERPSDVLERHTLERRNQLLKAICGMADLKNGAIGLYNVGLSCCLNSLLQVFFMNRHFTMLLRRIKVPFGAAERRECVPYQMLLLLEQMQRCKQKSVQPLDLARCLLKHNVKLFVLHDAAQLFLILWNLIMRQITDSDLAEELTVLFSVRLEEYFVCQKCFFQTKNSSSLLMLPIPMFDFDSHPMKTLEDSLRCFFTPEHLTGDNMCGCEQCDMKTPFLRSMKVTQLPRTLMLHLKRFCSNDGQRTQKLRQYFSFPRSLDLDQILTSEPCILETQEKHDALYELFAVVAHSGSAGLGHYCAYIWSLTEHKWYSFNDSSVCQVSWDDVRCTYGNPSLRWGETAYILVYLRKNP